MRRQMENSVVGEDAFPELAKAEKDLIARTGDSYLTLAVITQAGERESGHKVLIRPNVMMILATNKVVGEDMVRTLRGFAEQLERLIESMMVMEVPPSDIPSNGTIQ